ncbi:Hypothetical predicted protein [Pelobates cultripes]|uniref:Uncharacterized protein n=1 Tax=Pelobates cultripes TaxID=61616 RepID=A0AAD1RJL3_PELCU|nr:Hypothetical predicted protein [Pelobates cultripes]
MSERELDAAEGKEKSYKPSNSKPEHTGATSSKAASRPQSPLLTNAVPDMASSIGSEENSNYCEALEATLEALQSRAQRLVDKINEGRTKDQELMKSFNESLAMKRDRPYLPPGAQQALSSWRPQLPSCRSEET